MSSKWKLIGSNALNFGDTETKQDKIHRFQRFAAAIRKLEQRLKLTFKRIEIMNQKDFVGKKNLSKKLKEKENFGQLKRKKPRNREKRLREETKERMQLD